MALHPSLDNIHGVHYSGIVLQLAGEAKELILTILFILLFGTFIEDNIPLPAPIIIFYR